MAALSITGVQSAAVNVICELARKNPKNYLSLAPVFFKLMTSSTNNWMLIKIIKLVSRLLCSNAIATVLVTYSSSSAVMQLLLYTLFNRKKNIYLPHVFTLQFRIKFFVFLNMEGSPLISNISELKFLPKQYKLFTSITIQIISF